MARGVSYWYDLMVTEKENQDNLVGLNNVPDNFDNLLDDLTSKSRVSVWRLWIYVVAFAYNILETFWDLQVQDVQLKAAAAVYATDSWWVDKAKQFQYGDGTLGVKKDLATGVLIIAYDSTTTQADKDKRIITYAAISSNNGASTLKVAKGLVGFPQQLSNAELTAFGAYKNDLQPAGVNITVASFPADLIKYEIEIYYDAVETVENVTIGSTTVIGIGELVSNAIREYHSILRFNGEIQITKLIDSIQKVRGIQNGDVKIASAHAKKYGSTFQPFDLVYLSLAGYVQLTTIASDPYSPGTDDTTIKFFPK
jgi:hypothetical protein